MRAARSGATVLLVASYVVSTLCFAMATAMMAYASQGIGKDARDLIVKSTPAGSPLLTLHSSLGRLDALMALLVGNQLPTGLLPPGIKIDQQVKRVEAQLGAYLVTPAFSSELALRQQLGARWENVRVAIAVVRKAARSGQPAEALEELVGVYRPAVDAFDAALLSCSNANSTEANQRAQLISKQWHRSRTLGLILLLLSIVLTIATAAFSIRLIRRQTKLLSAQAEESVEFAGRVAHDILSPLSSIRMFFDAARIYGNEHPLVKKGMGRATSALDRVVATTDALLSFAQAGAQPADGLSASVQKIVAGVVDDERLSAQRSGVTLEVSNLPDVSVRCAPGVLSSVLSNLIRNAIKHMGNAPLRQVRVVVREQGSGVVFEVSDTGPGIEPAWQRRIFEPLVRRPSTTVPGIGLGLATTKRLVDSHGGRIELRSALGRGASFWVSLPRVDSSGVDEEEHRCETFPTPTRLTSEVRNSHG